ncbi:MAG: outer rane lipoproteinsorting protein [Acidobacteria bacterium]|nr:outer rane lipoproteinsorting protein [Acidobacteriota bacterium]
MNRYKNSLSAAPLGLILTTLLTVCCVLPVLLPGVRAQGKESPELQQVYRQMEAAGRNLRTLAAKISEKKYTAILKEFGATETGEFLLARAKDGSTMMRREITSPGKVILTIKGNTLTVYRPTLKEAQIVNLGKNRDKAEFLALGIAKPPSELQKIFDIAYERMESVAGEPCAVLLLKPKDQKTAAFYSAIGMWVKKSSGIPIQYKLQEPNNDYLLVTFSNERLNLKIPESRFEQKLPKGVEQMRF